jgi:hypothetical protein
MNGPKIEQVFSCLRIRYIPKSDQNWLRKLAHEPQDSSMTPISTEKDIGAGPKGQTDGKLGLPKKKVLVKVTEGWELTTKQVVKRLLWSFW